MDNKQTSRKCTDEFLMERHRLELREIISVSNQNVTHTQV